MCRVQDLGYIVILYSYTQRAHRGFPSRYFAAGRIYYIGTGPLLGRVPPAVLSEVARVASLRSKKSNACGLQKNQGPQERCLR